MKYIVELTKVDSRDHEATWCPPIESDLPIPLPEPGDEIELANGIRLRVVNRIFAYDLGKSVELVCEQVK